MILITQIYIVMTMEAQWRSRLLKHMTGLLESNSNKQKNNKYSK